MSIAVLYIASEEPQAFPIEIQRVLRMIGIMIEELLLTYQARQQVSGKRAELLDHPGIVDLAFKTFLTENDFIRHLERLLSKIQENEANYPDSEEVAFIGIDIDNHSTIAAQYGDHVARNLTRDMGIRLRSHLNIFTNLRHQQLYHINADRYYLLLAGMSSEDARKNAEQIRNALAPKYLVDAQRLSSERSKLPMNMLELPKITARLGIPVYSYAKLKDLLKRYPAETAVISVRAVIIDALDLVLDMGRREGGDVIISWDNSLWGYRKWTSTQ